MRVCNFYMQEQRVKFRDPDLSDNPINAEHTELGIPPIEEATLHPGDHPILRMAM